MTTLVTPTEVNSDNFLQHLLREQAELTAVENYAEYHDQAQKDAAALDDQTPAQARYYRSLLPATPPAADEQFAFEVDLDACSGCKACVVACHTLNGLEDDESWRRVGSITLGRAEPQLKYVTTACHHCTDPGCLSGCPVLAYDKDPDTGIVRHLDDQCIGCKYCTMMCPYEVPQYSHRLGIVRKCDMCHQRLSVGEAPACVQACPNEAISIRIVARQTPAATERLSPGAPLSSITLPTTRYVGIDAEQLLSAIPQDEGVDPVQESHWPLALMLVATQSSVGLLAIERLATWWSQPANELGTLAAGVLAYLLAAAGLAIAPLHLGQPLRAWRIFLGLRTSWLSREAVLFGLYMGLLSLAIALAARPYIHDMLPAGLRRLTDGLPPAVSQLALDLSLLVGLAALLSSAMIYVATRRQLWSLPRTLLRFLGTTTTAGSLLAASLLASQSLGWLAVVGMLFKLGWEWGISLSPESRRKTDYDRRSWRLVRHSLRRLWQARLAAGLTACSLSVLGLCSLSWYGTYLGTVWLALAAGVWLVGEGCERLLYFSSCVHDRMPGSLA